MDQSFSAMVEAIFIFLRYLTNLEEKGMEVIKCALKGGVYDYACLSLELARERVCPLLPKGREREREREREKKSRDTSG